MIKMAFMFLTMNIASMLNSVLAFLLVISEHYYFAIAFMALAYILGVVPSAKINVGCDDEEKKGDGDGQTV